MKKIIVLIIASVCILQVSAQDTSLIYRRLDSIAIIDQKVMMPMRDGVRLATDIYRPKGNAKAPIIFENTV